MSEAMTNGNTQYSKTRLGLILAALVFYMVVEGFGMFKLIPMQDAIMGYFGIGEGAYGYLATANNYLIILCSVPMGYLMRKYTCRWTFPLGFTLATLGTVIQIITTNYPFFVVGRVIEGAGLGFISMAGHSLVLNLVQEKRKGLWASIMVVCMVLPQVLISKGGSTLMERSGLSFQGIFSIIGAMYVLAMIAWILIVPSSLMAHGIASAQKATKEQTRRVYKNPDVWLTSIAISCFTLVSTVFNVYVIRFLMLKGMERSSAASAYSWATIIGLFAMLFSGILADKLGTKRKILIVSFLTCAVSLVLLALLPVNLVFIYVILYGSAPRAIVGLTNASAGDLAEVPSDIPIVNSLKNMILQAVNVLGGIGLGYLIQFQGYAFTAYVLAGCCVLGAICWILVKRVK